MDAIGRSIQLMHVRCRTHHGVDQARGCLYAVALGFRVAVVAADPIGEAFCEAVELLVALGHRVHFRIPLLGLVLVAPPRSASGLGKGGAGGIDDRCIEDRPLLEHHAFLAQALVHTLQDLLRAIWCSSSKCLKLRILAQASLQEAVA